MRRWATYAGRTLLGGGLVLGAARARAQPPTGDWHGEIFLGTSWHLATPLVIRLPDGTRARQRAHYATRPFEDSPYYAVRLGRDPGCGDRSLGYDVEFLHDKLYLVNPRPPVERFDVSHGNNIFTAGVLPSVRHAVVRVAVGLVVTHPEGLITGASTPRGTSFTGGYQLSGVALQFALGRRYAFAHSSVFTSPELKITAATTRVAMAPGGSVMVPQVGVHALVGLGARSHPGRC